MSLNAERGWHVGETLPRAYTLWINKETGERLNLTGKAVALSVVTMEDEAVTIAGTVVAVGDPTQGRVEVRPDANDWTAAQRELKVQFKVTDNDNKVGYLPSEPMRWPIWP